MTRYTITAQRLLRAWEATLDEPMARRGAALLSECAETPVDTVARWRYDRRDAALYELRTHLFGPTAEALATCPKCRERLEVPLDLTAMQPTGGSDAAELLAVGNHRVLLRLPNSDDLVSITLPPNEDDAIATLAERCVERVTTAADEASSLVQLPPEDREAVRRHLAVRLEEAEVELDLTCVTCGASWIVAFDIGEFLLREVDVWAQRLMRDVHLLARAYGWSEEAILALSARRRHAYLDLVESAR